LLLFFVALPNESSGSLQWQCYGNEMRTLFDLQFGHFPENINRQIT
jgi:hypothetical protein